jgi:hypothetical protein
MTSPLLTTADDSDSELPTFSSGFLLFPTTYFLVRRGDIWTLIRGSTAEGSRLRATHVLLSLKRAFDHMLNFFIINVALYTSESFVRNFGLLKFHDDTCTTDIPSQFLRS